MWNWGAENVSLCRLLPSPQSFLVPTSLRHVDKLSEEVLQQDKSAAPITGVAVYHLSSDASSNNACALRFTSHVQTPLVLSCLWVHPFMLCRAVWHCLFGELGTIYGIDYRCSQFFFILLCVSRLLHSNWASCDWYCYKAVAGFTLHGKSEAIRWSVLIGAISVQV